MVSLHERRLSGLGHLGAITSLLQRNRLAHPTAGLYEAADLQWWWRSERPTDELPQLVWFDDVDRPAAAVVMTAWSERMALDPLVLPDASPELVAEVMSRGLEHAASLGIDTVTLEVARTDEVLRDVLTSLGFAVSDGGVVEVWIDTAGRPPVSALHEGYRLAGRDETAPAEHHMVGRGGAGIEARLRQTSLYRPDLDLVVLDADGALAAYGLCWFDPVTRTGLVEPMRTEDEDERRGLARHVLTAGLDRLGLAGAERVKICFEHDNPASSHLYLDVGFRPIRQTDTWSR